MKRTNLKLTEMMAKMKIFENMTIDSCVSIPDELVNVDRRLK